ncbi:hypothetical protein [Seonamhaeicola sp.]|uniref:hypothetical protein n=1 Tax=Seonamhaeicola sp. TaxID=1912245 RepID=UPI002632E174|nr:hypothetical protein [Seonamhaeicola sp.]
MRTSNGPLVCIADNLVQTPYGLFITEVKKGEPLSPKQIRFLEHISYVFDRSKRLYFTTAPEKEFVDNLKLHGIEEVITSLKKIHDLALYNTNVCFNTDEKQALFNLKLLWEGLEQVATS